MTEQQTGVSTEGGEGSLTNQTTGMRQQPGVHWGVLHLPTVTHIPVGSGTGRVLCTTLWTGPWVLLLTKVFISHGGDKEGRVLGPLLDAGDVEERETPTTTPHRLVPLDGGNADEAGDGS